MKVERLTNRQELVTEALLFAPTREQAAHSGESCLRRPSTTISVSQNVKFEKGKEETSSESSATTSLVIKHGETTLSFDFS